MDLISANSHGGITACSCYVDTGSRDMKRSDWKRMQKLERFRQYDVSTRRSRLDKLLQWFVCETLIERVDLESKHFETNGMRRPEITVRKLLIYSI